MNTSKNTDSIPYNVPTCLGTEADYITQVIKNRKLAGDGFFNKKCVEVLAQIFPGAYINLTPSCTAALEMAYLLIDLKPGDEVIMPSFTFTSTATAVTLLGGVPVFIDVDNSLNMDLKKLEAAVTGKTKAICVVHYAGFSCDMKTLAQFCKDRKIFLVEDAAQSLGADCFGKSLGSFGDISAISFHETKNIICGEGGAIVVNNPQLKDRAEIIKDKGTNRQKFLKGIVDKYTWQDKGSSYLLGELPAAYLYAQLLEIEKISKTRKEIFDSYYEQLTMLATSAHLQLPQKNAFNNYNGHIFYIILKTEDERDRLMQFLKDQSISAVPHYVALHNSVAGLRLGRSVGTMNLTDDLSKRLLRLPLFYGLSLQNVERITESIKAFWK